jgi:hypothetical protein
MEKGLDYLHENELIPTEPGELKRYYAKKAGKKSQSDYNMQS